MADANTADAVSAPAPAPLTGKAAKKERRAAKVAESRGSAATTDDVQAGGLAKPNPTALLRSAVSAPAPRTQQQQAKGGRSAAAQPAAATRRSAPALLLQVAPHSSDVDALLRNSRAEKVHVTLRPALAALCAPGTDANALAIAVLNGIKAFIQQFVHVEHKALSLELDKQLAAQLDAMNVVTPVPPHVAAAIRHIRSVITRLSPSLDEAAAKACAVAAVGSYHRDRIAVQAALCRHVVVAAPQQARWYAPQQWQRPEAGAAPSGGGAQVAGLCVAAGDVVVVHRASDAVTALLLHAHRTLTQRLESKQPLPLQAWDASLTVSVVVLRDALHADGERCAAQLLEAGVPVTLCDSSACAHVLPTANAVLLGATAVLADGSLLGDAGCAALAATAACYRVPVYVAAETYKFVDRILTDGSVSNAAEPSALLVGPQPAADAAAVKPAAGKGKAKDVIEIPATVNEDRDNLGAGCAPDAGQWSRKSNQHAVLSLRYDLVPSRFITGYVTEAAFVPTASAPVVVRSLAALEEVADEEEQADEEDVHRAGDGAGQDGSGSEEDDA